jgi:flagellar FliL protein
VPVPVAPENEGKPEQPAAAHEPGTGPTLVTLAPITTNLASPSDVWIRLEASVLYDTPQSAALTEEIHQDLLALVRTLKMHQIEGASGYQHLKADLEERAAIRSGGHAKQLLIRTLLLE